MEITTEWAKEVFKKEHIAGFKVEEIISWSKEWEKTRAEVLKNLKEAK